MIEAKKKKEVKRDVVSMQTLMNGNWTFLDSIFFSVPLQNRSFKFPCSMLKRVNPFRLKEFKNENEIMSI